MASQQLIQEEGLLETIIRLVSFPIPLPREVIESVNNLSTTDKKDLIKQLLKITNTPLSRIHFIYLLIYLEEESYKKLARRVVEKLLSEDSLHEIDTLLAILKWVNDEFGYWTESKNWSPQIRLAMVWAHSHRILTILKSVGLYISWIRQNFVGVETRIPHEIFNRDPNTT